MPQGKRASGFAQSFLSAFRAGESGFANALHFRALAVRRSFFDWFKRYGVASQRPIQIDPAVCSGTAGDEEIERALTTDAAATQAVGFAGNPPPGSTNNTVALPLEAGLQSGKQAVKTFSTAC